MNNDDVISNIQNCVAKLDEDIDILVKTRNAIPPSTNVKRQQIRKLTTLISKMIAEKNSLESVINERVSMDASAFPPLDSTRVGQFLFQMNIMNQVIQSDQQFDQMVAIANGIKKAADEIDQITG